MRRSGSGDASKFSWLAGALGILGGLACTASMTLAALGILGAAAAQAGAVSMRGMSTPSTGAGSEAAAAVLGLGPVVLVVSAVLVVVALGLRRWQLVRTGRWSGNVLGHVPPSRPDRDGRSRHAGCPDLGRALSHESTPSHPQLRARRGPGQFLTRPPRVAAARNLRFGHSTKAGPLRFLPARRPVSLVCQGP